MKKYGILAYPAKHSLSPIIHNAAFKHLGLEAVYGFYEISSEKFGDFVRENILSGKVAGLSVSLPYKVDIIEYLDQISPSAEAIGAVNTLVFRDGILFGENTDWMGSNKALKAALQNQFSEFPELEELEENFLKGKKVVVLGAGGSARAIIYGLLQAGAEVIVVNRTIEKAEKIAEDFQNLVKVCEFDQLDELSGSILIHTTSIWLSDASVDSLPVFCDPKFVNKFEIVMDIVYKPLITPLLKTAQDLGKKIITGEKMLLFQALAQFELWTSKKAPFKVMQEALIEKLQ